MSLVLGQKMVRVSDGCRGVVVLHNGRPRIKYSMMADEFFAITGENVNWVPEELPDLPLREEEIERVAGVADQVLYCLRSHTPWRFWEAAPAEPHDRGLVEVIKRYLRADARP